MEHLIETDGLTRTFRRLEAVRGLDLRVPAGSIFALIGPNGAGKTTTIKLLMNLLRPTRGQARVLGVDSRRLGAAEFRRIGYVSENQRLPDWMTIDRLLDYCRPLYPSWDEALARTLRAQLDLTTAATLRQQSRGTRMKAALLTALAFRPDLVVLDEPFTGLDPVVRDELVRALLEMPGDRPFSVLVSSHDIDEVERLADHVGFMLDGRLAVSEPVSSLLERFRAIEVIVPEGGVAVPPARPEWLVQGVSGRTLRFIDTDHRGVDAETRIRSAFPGAEVRATPMTLREIFVTLARPAAREVAS